MMAMLPPVKRPAHRWNGTLAKRQRLQCDNAACRKEFFRPAERRRGAHDFCCPACAGQFRRRPPQA